MKFVLTRFLFFTAPVAFAASKMRAVGRHLQQVDVVVDSFKERNILNKDFVPAEQPVPQDADEILVDGEMIALEMTKLTPINIFTPNAMYFFDGIQRGDPPASSVYSSNVDATVTLTMTPEGLQSISKMDPITGETINVLPMEPGSDIFVEITASDVNPEELRRYEFGDPVGMSRRDRDLRALPEGIMARSLQGCSSFRVIELAVAYDSTFCADVGGSESLATAAVERIVSDASQIYQQPGLCLKIQIAAIDGFCDPIVDPYASIIPFSVSGIASEFMRFITNDPVRSAIPRDAFHLFYGGKPGFGAIGFAYLDVLCDNNFGFGVNEITFSSNPVLQASLLAHELGYVLLRMKCFLYHKCHLTRFSFVNEHSHNAGSNHDSQTGQNIMSPVICTCPSFSSSSVSQINSHVASVSCINPEPPTAPTDTPVAVPTSGPTDSPTASPAGDLTSKPTSSPTALPTGNPTEEPTTQATGSPTGGPNSSPTSYPTRGPTGGPTEGPTGASAHPTVGIVAEPSVAPVPQPTDAPIGENIILLADFSDSEDGFVYVPNAFFGVDSLAGNYNSGLHDTNAGENHDGALIVYLGGIDNIPISGVSGAWRVDFVLDYASDIRVSIHYQEELGADNEFADYSLAICEVDGTLYGTNGNYFMSYIQGDGDGGPNIFRSYVTADLVVPWLSAGTHTLEVGAYLHAKDSASEDATMRIDRVQIDYI